MRLLGWKKTKRLWDRLDTESVDYYRSLHNASSDLRLLGPCNESEKQFSDLRVWERRLKWRFIILWNIGRPYRTRYGRISDLVSDRADQIIGLGWLKSELNRRGKVHADNMEREGVL